MSLFFLLPLLLRRTPKRPFKRKRKSLSQDPRLWSPSILDPLQSPTVSACAIDTKHSASSSLQRFSDLASSIVHRTSASFRQHQRSAASLPTIHSLLFPTSYQSLPPSHPTQYIRLFFSPSFATLYSAANLPTRHPWHYCSDLDAGWQ